jgi:hypothetical protein
MTLDHRERQLLRRRRAAEADLAKIGCRVMDEPTAIALDARRRSRLRCSGKLDLAGDAPLMGDAGFERPGAALGASYVAWRSLRLDRLPGVVEVLGKSIVLHSATIVHPSWRRSPGDLGSVSLNSMERWLRRRLPDIGQTSWYGIGCVEASINVERNGQVVWQPHLHLVIDGLAGDLLASSLAIRRHDLPRYATPVMIKPVRDLGPELGYATKSIPNKRVAYLKDGRIHRRKVRLSADEQFEHDLWLSAHPTRERLIQIGFS